MSHSLHHRSRLSLGGALAALALGLTLATCGAPATPPPPALTPVRELRLYNWVDYMPPAVLEAFQAESGVTVVQEYFDTVEDAVVNIRAGHRFDVAVIDLDYIPSLVAAGRLAELDHRHIPNRINISPNFRDLATDPENRYSIPYTWGTTGLVARSDLIPFPVTRWADLWDPRLAGRLVARKQPTELISVALKAAGFALNSEDPVQLEIALAHLIELKPRLVLVDSDPENGVAPLLTGERWVLVGWSGDAITALREEPAITYRLPQEGTFLWGDAFVVSADSPARSTAEAFINFVLRPEISAAIVNAYGYPTANELAQPLLRTEYQDNPIIFPPLADLAGAEWYLPLTPDGEARYAAIWARFLAAP